MLITAKNVLLTNINLFNDDKKNKLTFNPAGLWVGMCFFST